MWHCLFGLTLIKSLFQGKKRFNFKNKIFHLEYLQRWCVFSSKIKRGMFTHPKQRKLSKVTPRNKLFKCKYRFRRTTYKRTFLYQYIYPRGVAILQFDHVQKCNTFSLKFPLEIILFLYLRRVIRTRS